MLNKDVYADADKDEATDHFGGTAEQRAEEASDQDPSSCHNRCREPASSSGVQGVYIEEGKAETDAHGVAAGRYRGYAEQTERGRLRELGSCSVSVNHITKQPSNEV